MTRVKCLMCPYRQSSWKQLAHLVAKLEMSLAQVSPSLFSIISRREEKVSSDCWTYNWNGFRVTKFEDYFFETVCYIIIDSGIVENALLSSDIFFSPKSLIEAFWWHLMTSYSYYSWGIQTTIRIAKTIMYGG